MNQFDATLNERLAAIRDQGLYRELRRVDSPQAPRIEINGQPLLNFSSNDYLGLANEPLLREAAIKAVEKYGAGAGASRLICGSLAPHHELEEALAAFKGTEAALSFSTGYAAAVGTIGALVGKDDVVVIDKLVHASIVDGARLSGAKLRVFAHNDLNDLEKILKWAEKVQSPKSNVQSRSRVLIVTESVFSMDGDCAPLREIVALKNRYGAWLMVDEAHATGLYGKHRRGLAEEMGVSGEIEVQMGTLGKALGASGGYITGSKTLIDYLVNRARSFIFSTTPVPAAAAAATAGIRFVQSEAGKKRNDLLWKRVGLMDSFLGSPRHSIPSAIIPIIVGDEAKAVEAAAALRKQNIYVPAIRYPTVARGEARLRVTITAAHAPEDVTKLCDTLSQLLSW
ncbi:MAG TPA: 8-amino-7-oxononanoate synthase [Verrucomicrobiae bacterium]|nr:8-amino-7-oxononanoate synthase [Verrucomicrobiae bacterium]